LLALFLTSKGLIVAQTQYLKVSIADSKPYFIEVLPKGLPIENYESMDFTSHNGKLYGAYIQGKKVVFTTSDDYGKSWSEELITYTSNTFYDDTPQRIDLLIDNSNKIHLFFSLYQNQLLHLMHYSRFESATTWYS